MTWSVVQDIAANAIVAVAFFCFIVVFLRNMIGLAQLLIAAWVFATRIEPSEGARELWQRYADLALPITMIAPAYNEELSIVESVKALLALEKELHQQGSDFAQFIWQFVGGQPQLNHFHSMADVPAQTAAAQTMSKALKKAGFTFVGPTICYAFMQSMGLVNDHLTSCPQHPDNK